jgi:hypothetical protein
MAEKRCRVSGCRFRGRMGARFAVINRTLVRFCRSCPPRGGGSRRISMDAVRAVVTSWIWPENEGWWLAVRYGT